MRSVFFSAAVVSSILVGCKDSSGPDFGPPAALTVLSGATGEGPAGATLATPLSVKVVDAQGRAVAGTLVAFSIKGGGGSLSATSGTTDAQGTASVTWTLGTMVGEGRVEARVNGVTAPAVFVATIKAGPATALQRVSNTPGSSAAGFELSDSVAIRVIDGFGNPVAGGTIAFNVTVGGGTVSPASAIANADGIARTVWTLGAAGAQQLRANNGALATTVDAVGTTCTQTQLAPGSVLTIGPADAKCVVLAAPASRYFVTVVNAAPSALSTNAFRFRGAGAGTGVTAAAVTAEPTASFSLNAAGRAQVEQVRRRIDAHDAIMRENERVMQQLLPQLPAARAAARVQASAVPVPPPNVGDLITLRIPNITNLCSLTGSTMVAARVVFVGQHGVMLEDTLSPTSRQLDTLYQKVGQEFDTGMWSVLNANFGNPLAMDPQTDNNARFYMLFSHVVNELQGGSIAGFVASSDFFPQSQCAGSNLAEIFYARVPTVPSNPTQPFASGTPESWYRTTRTVMMHEVKHIVSFAERFARGFFPTGAFNTADRWLEESSAMLAEELYARTIYGYQAEQNVTYQQSVGCEVRPNGSTNPLYGDCGRGKPLAMFDHFILLYDYESNVENLSPVGASHAGDFTFYGSGWSFLRWVIDTYGSSESGFLGAMIRETSLPGVQNVEARVGRTFADLVNDWAVALVMDDYPGFTPANPIHRMESWNVRDIFAGMKADFGTDPCPNTQCFFTNPVPLVRPASFGRFAIDVTAVRGGSMAVFEVAGTQNGAQLFEVNGLAGTSFPADMRVNIIRVQ